MRRARHALPRAVALPAIAHRVSDVAAKHCPLSPLSPLSLSLLLLAGCSRGIDTVYGQRQGLGASASVNGTAVLGEMFEKAGHRVFSWRVLSPRLQKRADCIVWFPDDFEPPSKEVRKWLEDWLTAKPDRTLIYVGRDFDAAPWYWEHVLPDAPAEQQELVRERLSEAQGRFLPRARASAQVGRLRLVHHRQLAAAAAGENARRRRRVARRHRRQAKTDIELRSRLIAARRRPTCCCGRATTCWSAAEIADDSQLIVVANGSFL